MDEEGKTSVLAREAQGKGWVHSEGVAKMSISPKALPGVEGSLPFNQAQLQAFSSKERKLDLIGRLDFIQKEARDVEQQRLGSELGEHILALYDEFRPRLFRYVRSLNLNRDQAEEVIQETFLRLATRILKENDIDNAQGWIVRVAHNLAVDMHRKNLRESSGASDLTFAVENRVDPTPNPEEAYSREEQIRRMETALTTFTPQQRRCFQLRAHGFGYKEIGMTFGISEQRAALIVKQVAVRLAATCG